jgi:uncharacterized repeat protein (TIGR03843 family)
VIREAEHGIGTLQVFVRALANENYFSLRSTKKEELCKIFSFDCLLNNSDRKGGHCILDKTGRVWSIDHGLTFHHLPKIRTVIWDFVGQDIPKQILKDTSRFLEELSKDSEFCAELSSLISPQEFDALVNRTRIFVETKTFMDLNPTLNIPWPLE